jgi:hypothetical protein
MLDPVSEFRHGKLAVGTNPVQMPDSKHGVYHAILLKADQANAAETIYVGSGSHVSADNGYPLAAGDELALSIDNPSKIWVVGSAQNLNIHWIAL